MATQLLQAVQEQGLIAPWIDEVQLAYFSLTKVVTITGFPLCSGQDILVDLNASVIINLGFETNLSQAQIDWLMANGISKYNVYFFDTTLSPNYRVAAYEV